MILDEKALKVSATFILAILMMTPEVAFATSTPSSIEIFVPAVTNSGGSVIKLGIYLLQNGTGNLNVNGASSIGNDTLYSSLVAFYTSLLLSDKDPFEYDARITFESNLAGIEGPSASLGIAEAFYILSSGKQAPPNLYSTVITGAVSPGGLSVMIGGVKEKASASCSAGAQAFALPVSNYFAEGRELQNQCAKIELLPASGVISLYSLLMGFNLTNAYPPGGFAYPPQVSEVMGKAALDFLNKSASFDRSLINSTEAEEIMKQLSFGRNYTAASLAISLYVSAMYNDLLNNYTSLEKAKEYLSGLNYTLQQEKRSLKEIEYSIVNGSSISIPALEAISTAESRLWTAEQYINYGMNSSTLNKTLQYASNTAGRIEAARTWIALASLNWSGYPRVTIQQVSSSLDAFERYSEASLNYARAISQDMGSAELDAYIAELSENYEKAVSLNASSEIFLKYALLSELNSDISSLIFSINSQSEESISYYYSEASTIFSIIYSNILRNGLTTIVTPEYMEYSTYSGLINETKVNMELSALSWSIPILFLSLQQGQNISGSGIKTVFPLESILASLMIVWTFGGMLSTFIALASYRATRKSS